MTSMQLENRSSSLVSTQSLTSICFPKNIENSKMYQNIWCLIWLAEILSCIIWWEKSKIWESPTLLLSQNINFCNKVKMKGSNHFKVHFRVIDINFDPFALGDAIVYYVKVQGDKNKKRKSFPWEICIWGLLATTFWFLGHLGVKLTMLEVRYQGGNDTRQRRMHDKPNHV